jgi:hypothetical protein
MKNLKLLAAITAACSALISGLQAAPITYSIVDNAAFQNGYTLSGSITTDGTIGALSGSNITNWTYAVTNTATSVVAFTTESMNRVDVNRLSASATQLTLLAPSDFDVSYFGLFPRGSQLSWFRITDGNYQEEGYGSYGVPNSDQGGYSGILFWDNYVQFGTLPLRSTADGSWIIAEVATSPIPEPSTYGLLFGGFTLAVVAMRRRTSKQA